MNGQFFMTTVAVHPAIIREALSKVYGAKALIAELQ